MAGYSKTPLLAKLGIHEGMRIVVRGAPASYESIVGPLPSAVALVERPRGAVDLVHLFVTSRAVLATALRQWRERIVPAGMIWISWPKRASKVPTDVTEDVIREVALPLGLVDVKVCAVDEIWSGLKLVIRKSER